MPFNDTMTALMDKARKLTGLTEKISIVRLTDLMDHFDLHVNPNLSKTTEITVTGLRPNDFFELKTLYFGLKKGTYTFSFRVKSTGSVKNFRVASIDNSLTHTGRILSAPITSDRQSYTFTVPEDNYKLIVYASGLNEDSYGSSITYYDCKLEVGDLATPLQQVGGVVKTLLSALHPVRGCLA